MNNTFQLAMAILATFLLGAVAGGLAVYLTEKPAAPAGVVDEVIESPALPPDSVIVRDTLVTREIRWRTVYRDTGSTIIRLVRDTVYHDSLKPVRVYETEKTFQYPFANALAIAYGPAPADSMRIGLRINWAEYYEKRIAPDVRVKLGQARRSGLKIGLGIGFVVGGLAIGLMGG
jgi:uncharacterized membrane protein